MFVLEKIPRRAVLGSLMFFACMFSYVIRTNLSINIVAMVLPTSNKTKSTSFCDSLDNSTSPNYTGKQQDVSQWHLLHIYQAVQIEIM